MRAVEKLPGVRYNEVEHTVRNEGTIMNRVVKGTLKTKEARAGSSLNPPLSAVNKTVRQAIDRIHKAGLPSAHCDARGRVYDRFPDGRREYVEDAKN